MIISNIGNTIQNTINLPRQDFVVAQEQLGPERLPLSPSGSWAFLRDRALLQFRLEDSAAQKALRASSCVDIVSCTLQIGRKKPGASFLELNLKYSCQVLTFAVPWDPIFLGTVNCMSQHFLTAA